MQKRYAAEPAAHALLGKQEQTQYNAVSQNNKAQAVHYRRFLKEENICALYWM
jgi:hypothetical protein